MAKKKLTIEEIYLKHYPTIPVAEFYQIICSDTVSTNLEREKLGMYAKWLLVRYRKNQLLLEDLYKTYEYFPVFDRLRLSNRLTVKDINKYKSLAEIYEAINPFLEQELEASKGELERLIKKNQAIKLYEDERFIVIHPKTHSAGVLYGRGTRWCTTSPDTQIFENYNSKGKLYIIIDKERKRKYQFHFETDSFADESDKLLPITFFNHMDATEGLVTFFASTYKQHIFALSHPKTFEDTFIVRQHCNYGIVKRLPYNRQYFNLQNAIPHAYYNAQMPYESSILLEVLVEITFKKIEVINPLGLAILRNCKQAHVYNFDKNQTINVEHLLSTSNIETFSLALFVSSLFHVTRDEFSRFLEHTQSLYKEKNQKPFNCIITNPLTAKIFKFFTSLQEDTPIDMVQLVGKLKKDISVPPVEELHLQFQYLEYDKTDYLLITDNTLPHFNFKVGFIEHFLITNYNKLQQKRYG